MLELYLPEIKFWDEEKEEFVYSTSGTYHFEHCLKSIFKWEGLYNKPFLIDDRMTKKPKTSEEITEYVRCMCVEPIDDLTLKSLIYMHKNKIIDYIKTSQTATTISKQTSHSNNEILTAEVIYYYMSAAQIPFECDTWHISRLFALLNTAGIKSKPPKKMGRAATMKSNAAINRARRAGKPG